MECSGRQRPPSLAPLGCEQSQTYSHPTTRERERDDPAHCPRGKAGGQAEGGDKGGPLAEPQGGSECSRHGVGSMLPRDGVAEMGQSCPHPNSELTQPACPPGRQISFGYRTGSLTESTVPPNHWTLVCCHLKLILPLPGLGIITSTSFSGMVLLLQASGFCRAATWAVRSLLMESPSTFQKVFPVHIPRSV